ncbi:MAG: aminoacyl-tRNA hydrolase [Aquisalinus sp.]|nr:aminoacyl-tRNA hydrolase [Aquisalinus sp.]
MLLIVGLGNPGKQYSENRHNVGFQLVDAIAERHGFGPAREKFRGILREGTLSTPSQDAADTKVLLLKPQTFYNESGNSVREVVSFYKIPAEKIIVIHDELDLAPGKVKMKSGGGTAGNNGLKSISSHIGNDFIRMRIGIGHPGDKAKVTAHVLGNFSKSEHRDWLEDLEDSVSRYIPLLLDSHSGRDKFLSAVVNATNPTDIGATERTQPGRTSYRNDTPPAPYKADPAKAPGPFDKLKNLLGQGKEGKS